MNSGCTRFQTRLRGRYRTSYIRRILRRDRIVRPLKKKYSLSPQSELVRETGFFDASQRGLIRCHAKNPWRFALRIQLICQRCNRVCKESTASNCGRGKTIKDHYGVRARRRQSPLQFRHSKTFETLDPAEMDRYRLVVEQYESAITLGPESLGRAQKVDQSGLVVHIVDGRRSQELGIEGSQCHAARSLGIFLSGGPVKEKHFIEGA